MTTVSIDTIEAQVKLDRETKRRESLYRNKKPHYSERKRRSKGDDLVAMSDFDESGVKSSLGIVLSKREAPGADGACGLWIHDVTRDGGISRRKCLIRYPHGEMPVLLHPSCENFPAPYAIVVRRRVDAAGKHVYTIEVVKSGDTCTFLSLTLTDRSSTCFSYNSRYLLTVGGDRLETYDLRTMEQRVRSMKTLPLEEGERTELCHIAEGSDDVFLLNVRRNNNRKLYTIMPFNHARQDVALSVSGTVDMAPMMPVQLGTTYENATPPNRLLAVVSRHWVTVYERATLEEHYSLCPGVSHGSHDVERMRVGPRGLLIFYYKSTVSHVDLFKYSAEQLKAFRETITANRAHPYYPLVTNAEFWTMVERMLFIV